MRDVWGKKGWGNIGLGGSAVFLDAVLCLEQQRNLNSKPQEFRAPPTKNILYGAMLGAMCGMYGGKRVGETLAWEEVLSFYIQFALGPAKEFKLKTSRVSSPTHKKHFVWCHVRGNVRDVWKHWLGRKCCLFTFSLCFKKVLKTN